MADDMTQLSFATDAPQQKPNRPHEPIVREAVIEGPYRFLLKRAWGAGPCVMWCGLNPSTADGEKDDPTMWREIEFSYRWGFGSLIKVNLYPFRSPSVAALKAWRESWKPWMPENEIPFGKKAFQKNAQFVRDHVGLCSKHIAAWGANAEEDDLEWFLRRACRMVEDDEFGTVNVPVEWHCIGKNDDGSPRHSLARGLHRVPVYAPLVPWSIEGWTP